MANSLLDFVMSLVRDPDAAARYAADPAGAIADAHLTDVTSADVNNLIPMVTDSMSTAAPTYGGGDGNVWTSGAATAAFDAFDAHLPAPVGHPAQDALTSVIAPPLEAEHPAITEPAAGAPDPFGAPAQAADSGFEWPVDDVVGQQPMEHQPEWGDHGGWEHTGLDDGNPAPEHPGFDLF
ncbi:MAG: Rv0340 family protein [Mycobacterium sp.]|nr:Rv0340 family protein [Mycobacterium sp.]